MAGTLVAGSINMDVVNRVRVHPKPGQTVPGLGLAYNPGGKGANQAVAVARSGGTVRMLGALGGDTFSETLIHHLASEGIDTSWIERYDGPAGLAFITVDSHGENTIIVEGGANVQLSADAVDKAVLAKSVLVGVDTLILQNEVPAEVTLRAMQVAKQAGVRVIFNPAPVAGVTLEWLKGVDVLVVNETEAEALSGVSFDPDGDVIPTVAKAIQVFLDAGAEAAIVTLGSQGSIYGTPVGTANAVSTGSLRAGQNTVTREGLMLVHQSAFSVPTVDTTAAGDTFVGSFVAAQSESGDIAEALQYASAAAALAVTKHGAQTSVPTKDDVMAFLGGQSLVSRSSVG